jgi:hypothetical protein
MSATLFADGVGYVVLSRFKAEWAEAGVFLLDVHCLDVKDAFFTRLYETEYASCLLDRVFVKDGREVLDPACARKLVEDAVAYGCRLGLALHENYRQACRGFGGVDARACARDLTFGRDGKPFYVQGPYDSERRARQVLNLLETHCGEGNYHYIVLAPGSPPPSPDAEWQPWSGLQERIPAAALVLTGGDSSDPRDRRDSAKRSPCGRSPQAPKKIILNGPVSVNYLRVFEFLAKRSAKRSSRNTEYAKPNPPTPRGNRAVQLPPSLRTTGRRAFHRAWRRFPSRRQGTAGG